MLMAEIDARTVRRCCFVASRKTCTRLPSSEGTATPVTGLLGFSGDEGPGVMARLSGPRGEGGGR